MSNENMAIQETENQEEQYIDLNELAEQLQQDTILNPIEIPINNLEDVIEYDKDEFQKGLKSMSFIAGQLTALLNTGISKEDSVTILVNRDNIRHAQKLQQMINDNNIEMAKIQSVKLEQQTL